MIEVVEQIGDVLDGELREFFSSVRDTCKPGSLCGEHDPRWLPVLRDGLNQVPLALIARASGVQSPVTGYLPLALIKTRLFGRFLVSLPYLNRAGVVTHDAEAADQLIHRAVDIAGEFNVQYLELRHHTDPIDHPAITHNKNEKSRMVLSLPDSESQLWQEIGSKVRNLVRKGEKHNLKIRWGGHELLDGFYSIFAVNMRDLGTPVYSRRLFHAIIEHFNGDAELAVVDYEGAPIAAALLVHDRLGQAASTQVPSASSLRQFNFTNANMWMYHQLLQRAIMRGSVIFDFGRSSEGSGTWQFKKQWGAQPQPTVWQYHLRHGDLDTVRPDNPRYRRRITAWRKLPVWVTRLVGPSIVRGIP